ncbi:MAG: spermidine/putrescine ABC transporter substrate-binding protein [Verrucomicrobiales bacterium]|nr:spermidine/putrescine ABC transporter substrate-binding protein [Verrucomicrobiales bacterium]
MKYTQNSILALFSLCALIFGAGCEKSEPNPAPDGAGAETADNKQKLVVFTWEDYIDEEVVAQFTEETGVNVEFEYYDNLIQMKALLRSQPDKYDVVVVDDYNLAELIDRKLVREIDSAEIPNVKNIDELYLNRDFDPQNQYSVPYLWGSLLVAYRTDKIADPEQSWNLLMDEQYKGKVALFEDKDDLFTAALLANGYSANTENVEEIRKTGSRLVEAAKSNAPLLTDIDIATEKLVAGEIWATMCYSGDALVLADENENVGCFIPSEGAPLWVDSFAVVRDAHNPQNAMKFIDFMSRGDIAARNAEYLWTATPNKVAMDLLDEEFKGDTTIFPPKELMAKCEFYGLPTPRRERETNQIMKDLIDALRVSVAQNGGSNE